MRKALLLALLSACATAAPAPSSDHHAVQFLEDDYPRALEAARERNVPLFVDAWAPWCHTCLSMQENVFTDPKLLPMASRFVFLSLDTEKPESAAFLEKFPQRVWPTLLVIEPQQERVALRWLGSVTIEQMLALLEDAERAIVGGEGADALLARADRLYGDGDAAGAAAALEDALAQAPADWPRRSRAVESLLMARGFGAGDEEGCARAAVAELPKLPRSASWANVAGLGLGCAIGVENPAFRAEITQMLERRVREALAPPRIAMAVDDRSGLYELLAEARHSAGDEAGTKAVAAEWLAYLETEAARAPTPAARAVYDSHRVSAALQLGQPERAVPALLQSEKDLPGDYNAPARLAIVYLAMGKLDEALAASDRALPLVYGPRKVRVLNDRGDILRKRGDEAAARATYEQARALAESLSPAQRPKRELERAIGRLSDAPGT